MNKITLIEIKKALYKQKPEAVFMTANKEGLKYGTILTFYNSDYSLYFFIPYSDIGDTVFEPEMASQLLIRYIIEQ